MADLSKCRPGNWLLYIPENQYCTFISRGQYVTVQMYNGNRDVFEDDLTFIKISADVLPLCKFTFKDGQWAKKVAGRTLSLTFNNDVAYLAADSGLPNLVVYIHNLQNTYEDLTRELLMPNIYGIKHPE